VNPLLKTLSKILLRALRREIERWERGWDGSLRGFKRGMISVISHRKEKEAEKRMRFRREVKYVIAFRWRFWDMIGVIWSIPGA